MEAEHVEKIVTLYLQLGEDEFVGMGMGFFQGFLMTPYVMKFWRMISIEQFNDPEIAEFYNKDLYEEPIVFQTIFFSRLIEQGAFKKADPGQLAVEFYAPMLLLFLRMLPFQGNEKIVAETLDHLREHILLCRHPSAF